MAVDILDRGHVTIVTMHEISLRQSDNLEAWKVASLQLMDFIVVKCWLALGGTAEVQMRDTCTLTIVRKRQYLRSCRHSLVTDIAILAQARGCGMRIMIVLLYPFRECRLLRLTSRCGSIDIRVKEFIAPVDTEAPTHLMNPCINI